MRKTSRIVLGLGILWLCLVCLCAYLTLYRPGLGTHWRQEPAPPHPLTQLTLGEQGEIIGTASNGTSYEFHYGNYQAASSWEAVTTPSGNPTLHATSCSPGDGNRLVLPPPGTTIARVSQNCVYMESGYHLEVALLENGEVWSWEHERYAYTELFLMFFVLTCGIIGIILLLTGAGLGLYHRLKTRSTPAAP